MERLADCGNGTTMRWMILAFAVVVLLIADYSWYRGYYTGRITSVLQYGIEQIGPARR
jgi:hypothetical protein